MNEKLPEILDISKKKRIFSELNEDEIIADEKELDSLRLLAAYYKNKGNLNTKCYSEIDLEKLDKIIDHLKKECIDHHLEKQSADDDDDDDARLIMCHNIIHAYSKGSLKNTHFRIYIYTSKKDIEISYKCNYKRSIFDSNERIMSNVKSTRLIDRYKKFKSTNYFKSAKFSNSIKMTTIENNIGYKRAVLCSIKH